MVSGPASCFQHRRRPLPSAGRRGLAMTTKHLAYNSSLHRDVRDVLALAAVIMFAVTLILICP
jgi:hypothetical protein